MSSNTQQLVLSHIDSEICKHFNIYLYYSPLGSKKYINEEGYFEDNGINVIYQNIQLSKYNQHKTKMFIPNLSILDLMSNLGPDKLSEYIQKININHE